MKKLVLTLALALGCVFGAQAQDVFMKGDHTLSPGVGFLPFDRSGYKVSLPPISVAYEYGVVDFDKGSLGIGGYLGMARYRSDISDFHTHDFMIGVRGAYHYSFTPEFELTGGAMLGYERVSFKYDGVMADAKSSDGDYWLGLYVGARYMFSPAIGAFAEVGYGITAVNIGITFRL